MVVGAQDPLHRRCRGDVSAFVEQDCPHLGGCEVAESFRVQHLEHLVAFGVAERPMRLCPRCRRPESAWLAAPVVGGA
jgi:hypothetical protein